MIQSINPYTQKVVFEVKEFDSKEIENAIDKADEQFKNWKTVSFAERSKLMKAAAVELRTFSQHYASIITSEMGKPITQALAEVEKCAALCDYYAEHAVNQLADKPIETEAHKSYVSYEPIGVVLAIMPWNYPFWQVMRFAVPALMVGNTGILKHASNVMKCAESIEQVFAKAGFPEGCFTNLPIGSKMVESIIRNPKVKAVTLTGSETAGRSVAAIAGSEIKKTVLELGGSNALVVFADCNLEQTVKTCVEARFQNAGQSCIAGKRLLVEASITEEFTKAFLGAVGNLKAGDPLVTKTTIGTMAREDLAEELQKQLDATLSDGATLLLGGQRDKAFFEPTVVTDVTKEMSIFKEEIFGPVIGITTFENEEEAVELANSSPFGLGVTIFTENFEKATKLIPKFDDGAVFVNELVKSDQRLPFGGTKNSGYGRELSTDGIQEFVNKKTVYIKKN
ncbi:succinate-semialdehyde dehydrogenase/glutarate-semialdehyde dehydrogenase [Flavobacterium sp. 270]|uniref:NAD-dependent succinate-semialdehyde dehydrogenase n=1 Tax=Flavobacterium sp. 270 TaxID=2512114 RepID=UPI001065318D|nr:NAD-dependent succinate-semialdehyde dehydrogenase [Flavobacterium sp. 270]TDW47745.1 succinate-semialdehyde dehydrogenase/glutarate-semialdehyde dehydrogenase [Flavobacterium sp. 270]